MDDRCILESSWKWKRKVARKQFPAQLRFSFSLYFKSSLYFRIPNFYRVSPYFIRILYDMHPNQYFNSHGSLCCILESSWKWKRKMPRKQFPANLWQPFFAVF
jgi:hypothetical protein